MADQTSGGSGGVVPPASTAGGSGGVVPPASTAFLRIPRRTAPRRPADVRIRDWREVQAGLDGAATRQQAGRCMDCGIPFCHGGCPLGNLIPEWNELLGRGDWLQAAERLHATNNFPEFTGTLCPAPCEAACVLGIGADPVAIKQIEIEIIDRAWQEGWAGPVAPPPAARAAGRRVAVIGSGPAGLAAAQQLTRAGHLVTVYERDEAPGGLLRYGIPEFKLEKWRLERRLDQMRAEGTAFACGVRAGIDVTAAELRAGHEAIVLACGARVPRELPIPGAGLAGIHQAMEYLPAANRAVIRQRRSPICARGRDVVIIGGGDTGADCLGTALRQGAASVTQLEIMPEPPRQRPGDQPWPTYPLTYRVSSAHEEGGSRAYAVSTLRFLAGQSGRVSGLLVADVRPAGGRFDVVPGTEREIACDMVLLAMGFTGAEPGPLLDDLGLRLNEKSVVGRDERFGTAVPGVFVAGDMGRGQSLIVWAIAEGRSAAAAADRYLAGVTSLPAPVTASARPYRLRG